MKLEKEGEKKVSLRLITQSGANRIYVPHIMCMQHAMQFF